MATTLECCIGRASKTFTVPSVFSNEAQFIEIALRAGSHQVINLEMKNNADGASLIRDDLQEVEALDLHRCVQKLTGNVPGNGRIDKIAVILADRYRPRPGVFGLMFDRGYSTEDDPNSTHLFTGTAREGCVIFVGAIKRLRSKSLEFEREVEYTTIHELGHLFNLGHVATSNRSYMATSRRRAPYPDAWFKFSDDQQQWLSECDTNPSVYPGGSKFDPVSSFNEAINPLGHSSTAQMVLDIGVATTTFPCSSPVEMDVEIRSMATTTRRFYVPDRLDPGYEEFKIWITYPNGEKRIFRSPRRYCAPAAKVMLRKERPIRRDISLFEGAGGSTFTKPGLYQIQAEYDLGHRRLLVSNTVTVEVVPDKKLMPRARVQLLSDSAVRRFLYHRSKKCGIKIIQALEDHLASYPNGVATDSIRYALARALTADFSDLGPKNKEIAIGYLYAMQDTGSTLGIRQRHHVNRLANRLT